MALAPLLSDATARPPPAGTSFASQPQHGRQAAREPDQPGPLNVTTRLTAIPARAAPSTRSLNQAATCVAARRLRLLSVTGSPSAPPRPGRVHGCRLTTEHRQDPPLTTLVDPVR